MKKSLFLLFLFVCLIKVEAQERRLSEFYVTQEVNASRELKTTLASARQEIAAKNLQYIVGVTSKAEFDIEKITGEKQLSSAEELRFFEQVKTRQIKLRNAIKLNPYLKLLDKRVVVETTGSYLYGTPF